MMVVSKELQKELQKEKSKPIQETLRRAVGKLKSLVQSTPSSLFLSCSHPRLHHHHSPPQRWRWRWGRWRRRRCIEASCSWAHGGSKPQTSGSKQRNPPFHGSSSKNSTEEEPYRLTSCSRIWSLNPTHPSPLIINYHPNSHKFFFCWCYFFLLLLWLSLLFFFFFSAAGAGCCCSAVCLLRVLDVV